MTSEEAEVAFKQAIDEAFNAGGKASLQVVLKGLDDLCGKVPGNKLGRREIRYYIEQVIKTLNNIEAKET